MRLPQCFLLETKSKKKTRNNALYFLIDGFFCSRQVTKNFFCFFFFVCRGGITCFKLSPNLRKPPKPPHSTSGKGTGTAGGARRRPPPSTAQSGDALAASAAAASTGAGVVVTEETSEEKARKATSLQRDHLGKALAVASTCRAAEADWVYIPRPRATPPP